MRKFPQDQHLCLRNNPRVKNLCYEVKECTRRHSGTELVSLKLAELLDVLHARLMDHATRKPSSAKRFQDVSEESRRTATADVKPCVATVENSAGQMDEDTFLRAPAISHPLEPHAEENVSKKARVARNVLHIRGEDELKSDVNGEAWPNADLAVRSSFEGALIDGFLSDKIKAGDEREIKQMKDLHQEGRRASGKSILQTGWARRMKGNEAISRCVLKDFATTVRDDVFAPTSSPISVRGLMLYAARYDFRVETGGVVCASMQADSSCEMSARPPKVKRERVGSGDCMERRTAC